MIPGAEPGTTNLVHYYRELEQEGRIYDAKNLPPLENKQNLTGFFAGKDFSRYVELCQGQQLVEVSDSHFLFLNLHL